MNVFVVFAPGLGGNHLANMIATDPIYHSRATVDQYKQAKKNAHHYKIKNLSNIKDLDSLDHNVLCGHFGEIYWQDNSLFKQKQVVIIQMPNDRSSHAHKRHQRYNQTLNNYFLEEQRSLYTPEVIEKLIGIKDHYTIPAESVIAQEPPLDLLEAMTYNIDRDKCSTMHEQWIKTNLSLV